MASGLRARVARLESALLKGATDWELHRFLIIVYGKMAPEERAALLESAPAERRLGSARGIVEYLEGRGSYEDAFGMSEKEAWAAHERVIQSRGGK